MKLLTDEQELDIKRENEFFELFSKAKITKDKVETIYTNIVLGDTIEEKNIDLNNLALKIKEEVIGNEIRVDKIFWIFDKYYGSNKPISIEDILAEAMEWHGILFGFWKR